MTLLNISSGFKPFHRETVVRGNEPKTVAICQITEEKITEEYKQHKLWNILEKKNQLCRCLSGLKDAHNAL